jgi:Zn-dependent M28 family amino/carboxypeptidase
VPIAGCKAANDNASGVAAVLELAKYFSENPQSRTIRFVAFTNEEPPFFWTKYMGSYVYAKECKSKNEKITAMLTPETIGCYSDKKGSQNYPFPLNLYYPSKGNFIAFVANSKSKELTKQCVKTFRENAQFPSIGACLPMIVPRIGSSDHWSFWRMGYPALMVTDTAPYRYRHYHKTTDNMENMDFNKMARVVDGLKNVITELAN